MAKLDISEKRLPQDGRIMLKMHIGGKKKQLDFRVSTLPTLWGEKIVLRLLDKENLRLDMTKLGFEPESLVKFEKAILKPYGMVLVTGPTGSGKTNTLYSSISKLNKPDTNIMTAEDPVEFQLGGVNQVQMKEQIGLNFAAALRAFLAAGPQHHPGRRNPRLRNRGNRHQGRAHRPPGALHAAHQRRARNHHPPHEHGHRAFPGGDLGSPHLRPAPGAPHLQGLCRAGRRPAAGADRGGLHARRSKTVQIMKGKGCVTCNSTGYKGRTGLYEVMEVDDEIRELVLVGASAVELKKKAIERGMITLRRSGLIKVAAGWTTLEEVARETIH